MVCGGRGEELECCELLYPDVLPYVSLILVSFSQFTDAQLVHNSSPNHRQACSIQRKSFCLTPLLQLNAHSQLHSIRFAVVRRYANMPGAVNGDHEHSAPADEAPPGSKRLVLCFDGTGNSFAGNTGDTNIVKLYDMLDRADNKQMHYYQRKSF
jgi:hypothetical protein